MYARNQPICVRVCHSKQISKWIVDACVASGEMMEGPSKSVIRDRASNYFRVLLLRVMVLSTKEKAGLNLSCTV